MGLRVAATGPADLDRVWQRYTTPGRWPTWAPQIRSVRCAEPVIRPGLIGTVVGPLGVRVPFRIDDVDEPRHTWSWTVRVGAIQVVLRHGVRGTTAGTEAWADVGLPRLVAAGYAPLAWVALTRLVRQSGDEPVRG